MKRFITISLLAALWLPTMACLWIQTNNSYLFSPLDKQEFRRRVETTCNDNWKAYLQSDKEYYWFDADEAVKTARSKNDLLMVSYIQNLQKYLACAEEKQQERWEYPTKEELDKRRQTLMAVRAYAQTKLKTRLRSQHALLFMRCNMMLDRHAENVTFWCTTASQLIESVYRDMMRNIYAGALYRTGSEEVAAKVFAEQGDWESLMTIYYKRRSCQAIREEYQREPDSPVLPFLLKDFVNNAQEAVDGADEGNLGGKLFIRDITRQEAQQMCRLCQQVVSEGKTDVPVMWQSAKAWLEYLFGNHRQGVSNIKAAEGMEGTARMKDNARVLRFYITAAEMPLGTALDDYVADELAWLESKYEGDDGFLMAARDRIVHQVLMKRYANQPVRLLAIEQATACPEYTAHADTVSVESMLRYIDYSASPADNKLDSYLKPHVSYDRDRLNDLVGTKYLRLCRWNDAISWLSKVPLTFYYEQGYARYAAFRHLDVEPWITRQWDDDDIERDLKLKSNPKIDFANEMLRLEAQANVLKGKALEQCWFDQAVRYAQAHFTGDCWYIMRDTKSAYDTLRCNEADLAAKATTLLQKASQSSDFALRERSLFALSYVYLNKSPWYEDTWSDTSYELYRKPCRQSTQWQAFARLTDFERQNATRTSSYVSRCDEYIQFMKHYRP